MARDWEVQLERWSTAGLVDAETAERIRAFEAQQVRSSEMRWPILIALAFGVLLLGSGVLLFVSAHWDTLSAAQRMTIVVAMVAGFHLAASASADRFAQLAIALHAVGTLALGAGIALTGQIFNMREHWPAAMIMWALGAAMAWLLLGHWPQAALFAILAPAWLAGEYLEGTNWSASGHFLLPLLVGVAGLATTYLTARRSPDDSLTRKALCWIGGIALIPAVFLLAVERWREFPAEAPYLLAWLLALAGPGAVAYFLRERAAVWNGVAMAWLILLAAANHGEGATIAIYLVCAAGSSGLAWWGMREARSERINLGILGFAITVMAFYFSNVLDKLDRSVGLVGLGVLFLAGGWALEKTRRNMVARITSEGV